MRSKKATTLSLEAIDQMRSSLSVRGKAANTVKAYATDLRMLLMELDRPAIPMEDLEEIGLTWLHENQANLSPRTTGRRLTSLRAFSRWAGYGEYFLDYNAPTPAKGIPHPIPEGMAGVDRLVEVARDERHKALVALCGRVGLRVAEALSIGPGDFGYRPDATLLTVRGKGDKTRIVPVSIEAWQVLAVPVTRAACDGRVTVVELHDRFARRLITTLGQRAGLSRHISSHDLRATFATAVYNKTQDPILVQRLLGHSSVETTQGYIGSDMERYTSGVEGL